MRFFSIKLRESLHHFYDKLPVQVRAFARPLVGIYFSLKKIVYLASQCRVPISCYEGKEKWGGKKLTTVFLGDGGGMLYVSSLLYGQELVWENKGKDFIWRIKSRLNSDLARADLIFFKVDGFFSGFLSRHGFAVIPEWLLFMMDVSRPLDEVWKLSKSRNKSLRENLREMRRQNYSYEMTQDPLKLEYFYTQMYLPYISNRFEKLTINTSFHDMKRVFDKGRLFLIKKENDYVSGSIIRIDGDTVIMPYLGVTEGRMEYVKAGALTALYYFSILWAKERGYKWVDFGHCRSFLRDGLLNHKKHWGMEIRCSERLRDVIGMKVNHYDQGVGNVLEKNPFIFKDQKKLKGFIFTMEKEPVSLEEIQSFVRSYSISGLYSLVILSGGGFSPEAEEFACSNRTLYLVREKPEVFFGRFTSSFGNIGIDNKETL